ncbi:MAG: transglycosylase domain-containing protein [Pseudanabaena sp.]|jgi:membrane peptidoglycan carboxypeptidase|nr:transglycosylase domain-containing protein [Pseudanabaena sp. M090S1SP2A07QC]MCA6505257.1 transglycosylase domain-containing protein [Pseudanabaena sp. M172S2SP2A07QC]MCA6520902.1 transglycosylase domain-containing protein [Pseudanabaena sp. M051S1SP2A07QC]MCA6525721.1 transglycosylase domain-containing protein [Pseudanabaena sp. M179S2SP2A07QC]MCA6529239.1 transglycosylase domain-containing protein [Pseudanabaena sp. M125S2SP2A07QC]MCA6532845.1 transglycosylase domain-containing protein [P
MKSPQPPQPPSQPKPPKSKLMTQIHQLTQVVNGVLKINPKERVPKLEVRRSQKDKPEIYDLVGDRYILGRSTGKCDIVVQTPLVSQVHAQLVRDRTKKKAQFILQDQDSTNGIYRQKQRLKSVPLKHKMKITLGPPELAEAASIRYIDPPPWYIRTVQYTGIGIGAIAGMMVLAIGYELGRVPDLKPLPVTQQGPVEVLAGDNIKRLDPTDIANHTEYATLAEFGQFIPKAVIASEDTSFYWNIGVDPVGVARAIVTNVRSRGERLEGASTITQQLARNLLGKTYVGTDDSAGRKWREAAAAIKLTFTYNKEEILRLYLNRAYTGYGVYGFKDAAKLYFGKEASELSLSEAATLVGLLPSPETINPFKNKNLAIEYRDRILNRMAELGMITDKDAERARRSVLILNEAAKTKLQGSVAPYYYSYVFEELQDILGDNFAREGNLIVETNLDLAMQKASDDALRDAVARDGGSYGFSQGAIVTVNSSDGSLLTMTGGVDYRVSQFNRASQALRQPGSTFKLFSYAAAIDRGISPGRTFSCSALSGIVGCHNGGSGAIDMYRGFALSENVVAVRVADSAGLDNVVKMAKNLGITAKLDESSNMVLGGNEVKILEMAGAYATVVNEGKYIKPHAIRRILDSADCQNPKDRQTCRVIFDAGTFFKPQQKIDAGVASTMVDMMRGVVQFGTGRSAAIPQGTVIGKTGTTDEGRDLWFIGAVPRRNLVTAVWLGNDEGVTNGSSVVAAQVWGDYMRQAVR